jgi:hypothetical protein
MTMLTALVLACPVCWGDAKSELVTGAKAGVLFLLVVVVGVLFAIAMIARSWAKRGRELDAAEAAERTRGTAAA